jgi:hypothetical protein
MWLCTQNGFYSVSHKSEDEIHVRARKREDLENLKQVAACMDTAALDWTIHRSPPPADYRWRIVINRDQLCELMVAVAEDIDYSNFKGRIHQREDQDEKSSAYAQLWHKLYQLQEAS